MPIYDFRCGPCDHSFVDLISIHDDVSEAKCPLCGKPAGRDYSGLSIAVHGGPTGGGKNMKNAKHRHTKPSKDRS